MFFGTISPSSTCRHDDDRDRDDERHRVQHRVGDADQIERLLQQVRHGRFADPAQQDRADRDAQLCAGQHQRQVLAGADHGDGAGACPARRGPRAGRGGPRSARTRTPTKNALAPSSRTVSSTPRTSPISAHLPRPESPRPSSVSSSRSMRRPSIRTDRGQPAHRVVERAVRIERRQLHRLTGFGNVAELLQHQAADGLVFALGARNPVARRPRRCAAARHRQLSRLMRHHVRVWRRRVRRGRRRRSPRSGPPR